jgi:hypothetical protein
MSFVQTPVNMVKGDITSLQEELGDSPSQLIVG